MSTTYYSYTGSKFLRRSMDRIRRSFRDSFRRRGSKDRSSDGNKPQHWQQDEATVRAGTCNFLVKYLGCVEVFESRGMQVCEEALKVLRSQRRRPVKAVLYVSGDGLRVVDAENKGLIVDQTIEKVSFCAPDRSHEKGFAYICRDGTTRRWMCHGFHATKETGERLSHAVGCAFAVCLEKKQKRDRDITPVAIVDGVPQESRPSSGNSLVRQGSFRQASLTERILDPQNVKMSQPPPVRTPEENPHAVARPTAKPELLDRQGSLRGSSDLVAFRRHHSLRMNDLPSTLARQAQMGQLPGARVSSIPEEDQKLQEGVQELCLSARPRLVHADTLAAPEWISAKSRAAEWLESTLLQTTGQGSRESTPPTVNGHPQAPPPIPHRDLFGQPTFSCGQPKSLSMDSEVRNSNEEEDDVFEAKWNALAKRTTNPFSTESETVRI